MKKMNEKTVETIEAEIQQLEDKCKEIKGSRCEVFARVCGYYRATESWNDGKKCEEKERLPFAIS